MVAKKPPRNTALVVSAIRKLRDIQGTTSREIMNFISSEYDVSGPNLKRHVQMALKRGMSYGLIHRAKGGYYLSNPKGLTISCDDLVDRGRRGGCGGRKRRRRKSRRGKCGRRRSRRRKRHGRGKCRGKRSRRKRRGRGKRRCGRRGRRRAGEDEMDEMVAILPRDSPRKPTRLGRAKFPERGATRSKSLSDRSSATRSSGGSAALDGQTQL